MKLRKPCEEHGIHYDPYKGSGYEKDGRWVTTESLVDCPGGVFLPDDTLIEVNVVAVRSRESPESSVKFREPWLVTACAVEKPEKPARYYLIPLDAVREAE